MIFNLYSKKATRFPVISDHTAGANAQKAEAGSWFKCPLCMMYSLLNGSDYSYAAK